MSGLRGLLKKKERIEATSTRPAGSVDIPTITIYRSTTDLQEEIHAPEHPPGLEKQKQQPAREFAFRTSANAEYTKDPTAQRYYNQPQQALDEKSAPRTNRLSKLLHRSGRSRAKSAATTSTNLPPDLGDAPPVPSISITGTAETGEERAEQEARWEKRATILASSSGILLNGGGGDGSSQRSIRSATSDHSSVRSRSRSISDARSDTNIQEAIRLHEIGDLESSTRMFGRLASPAGRDIIGGNNALAQVLYGLALRHGWGIEPDPENAVYYLSLAAGNAAGVERTALGAGAVNGGAAKGELVLAIYELANCLRNGWGVKKDAVAARQYYEAAANLGDTDAMDQVAQCYLDGIGGAKDKFKAAQYLRMAEEKGSKTVGNSWIWKDKYSPKQAA